jgi:hypothetical protein
LSTVKGQRRLQTQIARVEAEMELPLPGCINSAHRCSLRSMLLPTPQRTPDRVGLSSGNAPTGTWSASPWSKGLPHWPGRLRRIDCCPGSDPAVLGPHDLAGANTWVVNIRRSFEQAATEATFATPAATNSTPALREVPAADRRVVPS